MKVKKCCKKNVVKKMLKVKDFQGSIYLSTVYRNSITVSIMFIYSVQRFDNL